MLVLLVILLVGTVSAITGVQKSFLQNQILSQLTLRSQYAMERIVALAGQAVTIDPMFAPFKPNTGSDSHGLEFRLIQGVAGGVPIYDDALRVFIYGADSGTEPNQGLIIGRGDTLANIHTLVAGADGVLGTFDDDTRASLGGGIPACEALIPGNFAPQTGEMFTVNISGSGRLLAFMIRVNARDSDGNFLLPNDLVFRERVSLRQ